MDFNLILTSTQSTGCNCLVNSPIHLYKSSRKLKRSNALLWCYYWWMEMWFVWLEMIIRHFMEIMFLDLEMECIPWMELRFGWLEMIIRHFKEIMFLDLEFIGAHPAYIYVRINRTATQLAPLSAYFCAYRTTNWKKRKQNWLVSKFSIW